MIQLLTYTGNEKVLKGKEVIVNTLHSPQSLDEFDINIISLQDSSIWRNEEDNNSTINCINDLKSISTMIKGCKKTKIIILMPMNYKFFSRTKLSQQYWKETELKDISKRQMSGIIGDIYSDLQRMKLIYENTKTQIANIDLKAAFYIENYDEAVLCSAKSDKPTVVKINDIYISSLQFEKYDEIIVFLKKIKLLTEKESIPEWLEEMKMFDDNIQLGIIEHNNQIINDANDAIRMAVQSIEKNKRYKSVLYTNGEELVEVVFEILTEMLGCDLSGFEDLKNEDFLFEIENHIFIGEIKGVNHNVKSENVSQLDVHYQRYLDEHPDIDEKNISAILIMNHQKNKPVLIREPIHVNQINLAKRNGSLIIDTLTLLKVFEKYRNNEMDREQCIELFKNCKGLLKV